MAAILFLGSGCQNGEKIPTDAPTDRPTNSPITTPDSNIIEHIPFWAESIGNVSSDQDKQYHIATVNGVVQILERDSGSEYRKNYPKPDAFLQTVNEDNARQAVSIMHDAETEAANKSADEHFYVYMNFSSRVYRSDSRVFSLISTTDFAENNSGGIVPIVRNPLRVANINPKTGEEIAPKDAVDDFPRFYQLASRAVYENFAKYDGGKMMAYLSDLRQTGTIVKDIVEGNFMNGLMMWAWSPTYLGLRLIFNINPFITEWNDVTSALPALIEVVIPYANERGVFHEYYTEAPENYFAYLSDHTSYILNHPAGVKSLQVNLEAFHEGSEMSGPIYPGCSNKVEIITNGISETVITENIVGGYMGIVPQPVAKEGALYLWLIGIWGQYNTVYIYKWNGKNRDAQGAASKMVEMAHQPLLNPADFFVMQPYFFMGAHAAYIRSKLMDDGYPTALENQKQITGIFRGSNYYTLKMDLECMDSAGNPTIIPAGSDIRPAALIPYEKLFLEIREHVRYSLDISANTEPSLWEINGRGIDEYFDYTPLY